MNCLSLLFNCENLKKAGKYCLHVIFPIVLTVGGALYGYDYANERESERDLLNARREFRAAQLLEMYQTLLPLSYCYMNTKQEQQLSQSLFQFPIFGDQKEVAEAERLTSEYFSTEIEDRFLEGELCTDLRVCIKRPYADSTRLMMLIRDDLRKEMNLETLTGNTAKIIVGTDFPNRTAHGSPRLLLTL